MYIAMNMKKVVMALSAVALLCSVSYLFTNMSLYQFLLSPVGKILIVALAILSSGHHLLYGLAVALVFVLLTNSLREGMESPKTSDNENNSIESSNNMNDDDDDDDDDDDIIGDEKDEKKDD